MSFVKELESLIPANREPFVLSMSSAGMCERRLDYTFRDGSEPPSPNGFLRMEMGHAIHEFLQGWIKSHLGDRFHGVEEEVVIEYDGIKITGHPDGIVSRSDMDGKFLLEIKSVGDFVYKKIVEEGKPLDDHIAQANLYAKAIGVEWICILYVSRGFGDWTDFTFEAEPEVADVVLEKFARAHGRGGKTISSRPHVDRDESPCSYCPWVDECYGTIAEEVGQLSMQIEAPQEVLSFAQPAAQFRKHRLSNEKSEEQFKKDTIKAMLQFGIKEFGMEFPWPNGNIAAKVKLKSTKGNNFSLEIKEIKK